MPYIRNQAEPLYAVEEEKRTRNRLYPNSNRFAECAGELNYQFTEIIDVYLSAKKDYQAINDVIGALECCKLELYRRVVAPYEDKKIKENGDVYSPEVLN